MQLSSTSCLLLLVASVVVVYGKETSAPGRKDLKEEILPPCQACKTVVNSFIKGMSNTNKKHFGGGDTAWEEEKMGDYAQSEVRLIEIQEHLCSEVDRGQSQCYKLAEEWESTLEEWWFKHQKEHPNLHDWFCVKRVEHCCPENHFGPECKPCPGHPDNVCSNNGKCKGSGTRKGNGECNCNPGYEGPDCFKCADNFYESYRDDKKLLCSKCHAACKDVCSGPGPKSCKDCSSGWIKDSHGNCLDLNECISDNPCSRNEFCVNNEGSFTCLSCDKACDGCHGDGPDMCDKCAKGFALKDGICMGGREWESKIDWNRYLTYLGLTIATCIVFQKNTYVAALIGVCVAVYVSVSEYMLSTMQSRNVIGQTEFLATSKQ